MKSLRCNLRAVIATSHRLLRENLRVFTWGFLFSSVLESLLTIALAYFLNNVLFQDAVMESFQTYTGSDDYLSFIVIGVTIQAYANGALLGIGRSLIIERRIGTLESLYLTPSSNSAFMLGVSLQQALLTSIDFLIISFIGIMFGADLTKVNWGGLVLTLVIGHLGFLGMGIMLAAAMLYLRDTYLTQNTVLSLLALICGIAFPIQYLPKWVQSFANIIPLTHTLALSRKTALLGLGFIDIANEVALLALLSALYCGIGIYFLSKVRRVALEVALS